jgi:hypothetical protein
LFLREFAQESGPDLPAIFFRSTDGTRSEQFFRNETIVGRPSILRSVVDVLAERAPRASLLSEAGDTLETHRVIDSLCRIFARSARTPSA